jgi:hypothetical protein
LRGDGQDSFLLQFFDRERIGFVPIDVDDPWGLMFGSLQHLAEEAFGCPRVSFCADHKINRLAGRIDGVIKIFPRAFHFYIGFINAVGVIRQSQVGANSSLQFWSVRLNPPVDRRVINR